jgi:hypothetical protein
MFIAAAIGIHPFAAARSAPLLSSHHPGGIAASGTYPHLTLANLVRERRGDSSPFSSSSTFFFFILSSQK